jgi:opacity protein-like surface antigen
MKKTTISMMFLLCGYMTLGAQSTAFGISAGYNSLIASVKVNESSASDSASGFYAGLFADFTATEKIHVQPEVLISYSTKDGDGGSMLVVPIIGKYLVDEKFNLQFGPQLDYILEDDSDGIKKLGLGLAAGIGYDISNKISATVRYSLGLTNRLDESSFVFDEYSNEDPIFNDLDIKTKLNFLQVGIGYKF